MLPRSTHETFAQKLYQSFKNNKCFSKPKLSRSDFTICHYAGDVTYQTELSLEKNKDYVVVEHQALLAASKCFFISSLFLPSSEDASKPSKFSSIGSKFKADIEETKTQENEKLQVALQEMQQKFDEMKALLAKEREVANVAVKEVSFIKEVPVSDTALLDKLRDENEKLKALVSSLKAKIAETEKKYEESIITSEQRLKKAMEAESEIVDLKNAMDRLQEKLSSLESEAQILRQRAVFSSPIKSMQEHLSTPITPTKQYLETDQHDFEEMKVANLQVSQSAGQALRDIANSDAKLRRSSMERNQENLDALIKCVSKNIGFSQEKPVAASTIYKCLLHWKSFEVEKTSVFDRLIEMFGSVIEEEENNNHLAYWLSNGSHLLYLLQHNLKVTSAVGGTPNRKPTAPTSFFGRMTRSFRSSSHALDELSAVQQVEAKYPALLFKLQLTAYVEKIYGIIRDNVKKDLLRLLSLCIQAPRAASVSLRSTSGLQVQSNNWQAIIERFDNLLNTLQENYVLFQKSRVSFDDIVNDLCPVLSSYQLYRIGTHYWDDKYNTKSVSADVLSRLRRLMSEVTSEVKSSSFLLDDNSSIPFSVDEISNSLRLEEFLEVRPAADLLDDPAFYFLLQ
ncbi:myosin-6-like isoform X1 [Zingiber officinale]|uniref:myosin-6-like isoform X1 n=1 Tax=Zingiber officinale TaxID=94328 RepID=UPI001C4D697F|nr:myosin-6-like isoform X1 [Zingiber officinale]XP_042391354.1 myosin-6-like isoform X1 [Zingiber officinale]XP_042391355.1 myosin-6-like isoform X1 [Zingiber officinale]XP_042391356.1 myosin-6-like isoform X1 [Zingiber officinale]XP_042391358.1 myosin-6-like isoform X1 [Zingiber officinale]